MSVIDGLAAYKARKQAEEERREQATKPKHNRIVLEDDGDSVVVRFAQEVDYDAKHYNEEAGIGFVNIEHTCGADPKNGWKNRANCTKESQGACYPCAQVRNRDVEWDKRKGWKQKEKFYINVIAGEPKEVKYKDANKNDRVKYLPTDIDRETGDGTVYLLEQGTYNGIWDQLAQYAVEDETITETYWKITRKGKNFNDTSYTLTKLKEIPADAKSLDEFELIDIKEEVLVEVEYNQQEAFYYRGIDVVDTVGESEPVAASATVSDDTW